MILSALITGTSSGVGLSTAITLAKNNFKVFAGMRDLSKSSSLLKMAEEKGVASNIEIVQLDVTQEQQIDGIVEGIIKKAGKLDVLINNAGYSIVKVTESTSMEEFHEVFNTNFFGAVAVAKSVIPHMRNNRSGHIINISSIGGLIGQPFNDAYCAAKFAVSGWSESMHLTLKPFGVHVTLVCPGAITTPFLAKARSTASGGDSNPYLPLQEAYSESMRKIFTTNAEQGIKSSQTPEEISDVILEIISSPNPHQMYLTSEYISSVAGNKYKDVTGDSIANMTARRSFGNITQL